MGKQKGGVCLNRTREQRLGEKNKLGRQVKSILVGSMLDSGFFPEGDTGCYTT